MGGFWLGDLVLYVGRQDHLPFFFVEETLTDDGDSEQQEQQNENYYSHVEYK